MDDDTTLHGDRPPPQRFNLNSAHPPCHINYPTGQALALGLGNRNLYPSMAAEEDSLSTHSALSLSLSRYVPYPRPSWQSTEEDLLACILIHTWALATGRVLRSDVPPGQLSEEELIAFWADDHVAHGEQNSVVAVSQGHTGSGWHAPHSA